jgi:hypothetical protein
VAREAPGYQGRGPPCRVVPSQNGNAAGYARRFLVFSYTALLVLFVNDSENSKSADVKPISPPGCIYLVSPGALRAPTPPRNAGRSEKDGWTPRV